MKILDKYLLKTFLTTFSTVFIILLFIFILQTVWLFIADLAGKDLDFFLILKFLVYAIPTIIPLVLPLSILLASIMTFGDLSENYEFAAMKSSGVSLQRALKGLTVFIVILSFGAFLFANNIIPLAQYKFTNFRKNIAQVKPAMAIGEGQFSEVGLFNIKVEKKSGENGNLLEGVTIHKKSSIGGISTVIKAERGELLSSENSNVLQLVLFDGHQYEDILPKKFEERRKFPFSKSSFKKYIINMDLTELNKVDLNEEQVANTNTMLNVSELRYTLDSLSRNYEKDLTSYVENNAIRSEISASYLSYFKKEKDSLEIAKLPKVDENFDLMGYYDAKEQSRIYEIAKNATNSSRFNINGSKEELISKRKNINEHWIALHDKFVIAYACLLMFFIGAPLGAIIRKGGLGLPIVFAVLIFIIYHFINTFGKKIAQEDQIMPFLGAWMASILLTPLAILLTYRATNDIGLINMDIILMPIQNFFKKIFPQKNNN